MSGVITAGNGLSAFVWVFVYERVLRKNLETYFLTTFGVWAATALIAGLVVFREGTGRGQTADEGGSSRTSALLVGTTATASFSSRTESESRAITTEEKSLSSYGCELQAVPFLSNKDPPPMEHGVLSSSSRTALTFPTSTVDAGSGRASRPRLVLVIPPVTHQPTCSTRTMLSKTCYWLAALQFILIQTVAATILGNLAVFQKPLGWSEEVKTDLISLQSVVNACARILFGLAMDLGWRSRWRIERARCLLWTAALMLGCLGVLWTVWVWRGSNSKTLTFSWIGFLLLGLGFGGNWAVLPAVLSSWYGNNNVAIGFNVCCLVFVCCSNALSAWVSSQGGERSDKTAGAVLSIGCEDGALLREVFSGLFPPLFDRTKTGITTEDTADSWFPLLWYTFAGMGVLSLVLGGVLVWVRPCRLMECQCEESDGVGAENPADLREQDDQLGGRLRPAGVEVVEGRSCDVARPVPSVRGQQHVRGQKEQDGRRDQSWTETNQEEDSWTRKGRNRNDEYPSLDQHGPREPPLAPAAPAEEAFYDVFSPTKEEDEGAPADEDSDEDEGWHPTERR